MSQKHVRYIMLVLAVVLSASSCALYEEVTFHPDGKITYNLTLDTKELIKVMTPSLLGEDNIANNNSSDSIISLSELIAEQELTDEEKQWAYAIKPFSMRKIENFEDSVFTSSVYGTFDNDKQLNEALIALNNIFVGTSKDISEGFYETPRLISQYAWDGTTMKRYTIKNPLFKEDRNTERTEEKIEAAKSVMNNIYKSGNLKIKYHFPHKVKNVNNPEATFSQDGKTVITDHKISVFNESPQDADISITVATP